MCTVPGVKQLQNPECRFVIKASVEKTQLYACLLQIEASTCYCELVVTSPVVQVAAHLCSYINI